MDQALVVGVSHYQFISAIADNQDVAAVRAVLADSNVCGYPTDRVRVLTESEATRANILAALEQLGRDARASRGRTFFYFSGHGGQDAANDRSSYILPFDVRKGEYSKTAISAREVAQRLANDGETTVVLDCCFAGGMGDAIDPGNATLTEFDDSLRQQMSSGDRVLLAASRPDALAYGSLLAPYGSFTGHLLEGLRGKASTDGLTVNVHELFNYVQKQIRHENKGRQHASFIANIEGFFTLARYPHPQVRSELFEKDAYIAYDPDDNITTSWVEETLRPQLEREGISTWDASRAGANQLDFEEDATNKSRYIVAVITAAALKDPKSHIPRTMGILQAVHTRTPRFIPVLREHVPNLHSKAVGMFGTVELHERNIMSHKRQMDLLLKRLKKPPHLK